MREKQNVEWKEVWKDDYLAQICGFANAQGGKLYIANCGHLPENWTVENLFEKHASQPFNPNIAYVFYLAGFIESWGRGIEKSVLYAKIMAFFNRNLQFTHRI